MQKPLLPFSPLARSADEALTSFFPYVNSKPKICLIHTGGTIGMIQNADGVLCPPESPLDLPRLAPELEQVAEIDSVPLLNKDSTNITPADWTTMAHAIFERRHRGYDGFVITHGTDTMPFSAAALTFALGPKLFFPVILTGAQAISGVVHGDARINLVRAVHAALSNLSEVAIVFGNHIFRGCRTRKKDYRSFDAFHSPAIPPIGEFTAEILLHGHAKRRPDPNDIADIDLRPDFAAGILPITLIPGLEPDIFEPIIRSEDCKGVIVQAFGAGNLPNQPPYSFEHLIRLSTQLGKPVLITTQETTHSTAGRSYAPGFDALQAGAIPAGNMTHPAASVKFHWVLAEIEKNIQENALDPAEKIRLTKEKMRACYVSEMD
uniref:L-asparaginase n=1 Tax=Candidatus Kentrum sp. LPFa TaxID=2126335 RepID=A0A450W8Y5_9GAMM|nr:MAG: L-asparaginase [Candidatus Kentron sp. LPFa]VFK34497.1 MAG: L-asparaginase [Candidatus Kentron sp. LPFa]